MRCWFTFSNTDFVLEKLRQENGYLLHRAAKEEQIILTNKHGPAASTGETNPRLHLAFCLLTLGGRSVFQLIRV